MPAFIFLIAHRVISKKKKKKAVLLQTEATAKHVPLLILLVKVN